MEATAIDPEILIRTKIQKFMQGWESVIGGDLALMPGARQDKATGKFQTWREVCEPKSVFECFELGKREATLYKEAAGIGEQDGQ